MQIIEYFNKINKLSQESAESLENIIRIKSFPRLSMVQEPGSRCRTVYIMKSGIARIFYYKNGHDVTEHFAFENDMIIRAESLFTGNPTFKGIQTLEDSEIYAIDSELLFSLFNKHHDIERLFRLIIEKDYVNTIHRIENLQFKTARERYLELLKTTDFVKKIPLKHIASYLGITQVSLSRIRAGII